MKKTILFLSVFATAMSLNAAECPKDLKDYNLSDFLQGESSTVGELTVDGPYKLTLTRRKFEKLNGFKGFSYDRCKDSLKELIVESKTNKFVFYYTNEDSCDGGNSYGVIFKNSKVVGNIQDQQFYCR